MVRPSPFPVPCRSNNGPPSPSGPTGELEEAAASPRTTVATHLHPQGLGVHQGRLYVTPTGVVGTLRYFRLSDKDCGGVVLPLPVEL